MTELKVTDTNDETRHGNTRIQVGDRVKVSGGMNAPTGKCVVMDITTDEHSGDKMVMVAPKRDGGTVTTLPAESITRHYGTPERLN